MLHSLFKFGCSCS